MTTMRRPRTGICLSSFLLALVVFSVSIKLVPCTTFAWLTDLELLDGIFSHGDLRSLTSYTLNFTLVYTIWLYCAAFSSSQTVDRFVAEKYPIAKAGILANIGPVGRKSSGAMPGVVIASPSTSDPDYLYTWTRDSALVFKTLVDMHTRGEDKSESLRISIDQFVAAQAKLQQVSNPSGMVSTGGLGEPKFHIDLSAFTENWGRPQRDGPALRATTLITYADWLISNSNASFVSSDVWPVVKLDLDYVATSWNLTGFDLWEEVSSSSFFTSAAQHRALRQGAALASKLNETSAEEIYNAQADNVLCFMQSYWNPDQNYMTANTGGGRSGIDANTVLTSIHNFDAAAGCDSATFQPCSDRALANLKTYVDAFRSIYGINSGIAANASVATGRYPEDVYYGGNPWYLTTLAVAEQLYDALIVWNQAGTLNVTSVSLPFFQQFSRTVTVGSYSRRTITFKILTAAVKHFADGFVLLVQKYTPEDGALSEQYSRDDGNPLGASDLTWSYAATLTAFAARDGVTPPSWGAEGLAVPSSCSKTVTITFNILATTSWGENIFLTGSLSALKDWSTDVALDLSSESYPTWSVTVVLPADTYFEYKYIRKRGEVVSWESDPNMSFTTPPSGTYTLDDSWR